MKFLSSFLFYSMIVLFCSALLWSIYDMNETAYNRDRIEIEARQFVQSMSIKDGTSQDALLKPIFIDQTIDNCITHQQFLFETITEHTNFYGMTDGEKLVNYCADKQLDKQINAENINDKVSLNNAVALAKFYRRAGIHLSERYESAVKDPQFSKINIDLNQLSMIN